MSITPIPKRLERQVCARDDDRCQHCGIDVRYARKAIHHIVPEIDGGPTTLENLQLLCEPCHLEANGRNNTVNAKVRRNRKKQQTHQRRMAGEPKLNKTEEAKVKLARRRAEENLFQRQD